MRVFGGMKMKGEVIQSNYNLKNKKKTNFLPDIIFISWLNVCNI